MGYSNDTRLVRIMIQTIITLVANLQAYAIPDAIKCNVKIENYTIQE